MGACREFTYPSADGVHAIQAVEWVPDGAVRGVIQIVHGLSEYMGRYGHVARFFNDCGYVVCGGDHLGHGKTVDDGKYGYFADADGWDFVVRDVYRLRQLEGERWSGVPYVLLGHSMGSFLVRECLIRWPGLADRAVLSGTGQEPAPVVAAGKAVAGALCRTKGPRYVSPLVIALSLGGYNKAFQPNRTPADWISRDEGVVDAYVRDPLCRFLPTVSMFRDMMGGLQFIGSPGNLKKMNAALPVYFMSGERDPVGAMGKGVDKVAGMFRKAGCTNITVKLYPGARHELFNEINKEEVLADLLNWLEETR